MKSMLMPVGNNDSEMIKQLKEKLHETEKCKGTNFDVTSNELKHQKD